MASNRRPATSYINPGRSHLSNKHTSSFFPKRTTEPINISTRPVPYRWTRDKPMSLSFDKERWAYIPDLPYLIPPTCRTNESLKREICLFWINNTSQNGWLQQSFHRKIYASTLLCAIDTMGLGAMDMEREYLKLLDGTILRAQLHTCHTWRGLRDISYSTMRLVTQRSQLVKIHLSRLDIYCCSTNPSCRY